MDMLMRDKGYSRLSGILFGSYGIESFASSTNDCLGSGLLMLSISFWRGKRA